jgi:hypothetical protein
MVQVLLEALHAAEFASVVAESNRIEPSVAAWTVIVPVATGSTTPPTVAVAVTTSAPLQPVAVYVEL